MDPPPVNPVSLDGQVWSSSPPSRRLPKLEAEQSAVQPAAAHGFNLASVFRHHFPKYDER
ncbi:hypothetical protein EYF80_057135 [Liparis tanakae]|uniref:Uncharacterized protein n=1 Tax=Liparis tanakae TaxID=230148 RepID=A0A4Z2EV87_9TELE|nr:hypothetical protein EYF80_057135 [Liparis tanakae]